MNPFASIWDDLPIVKVTAKPVAKEKSKKVDHSEVKAIYEAYLIKKAELVRHREYADKVAKATSGSGMTLVMPLATMGTDGGPLLCDYCKKPIILEGGKFNRKYVDEAWKANPDPKWRSWISGGLMVRIIENDTLRIYHGYEGVPNNCDTLATIAKDKAESEFKKDLSKGGLLYNYLQSIDKEDEFSDVMNVMFFFDPGFGVNRP